MTTSCFARSAAILLVTMLVAGPAHAQWQAEERIETYPVSGTTGFELYRSIGENGPAAGPGRAIAHTDFDLLWSRDYRNLADGSCVLASARPSLTITYRLPEPANALPEPVRSNWATFIEGVEAHERVHGDIVKDMTRRIEAVSVGLTRPDDPDCNKVRAELQRQLVGIVAERDRKNRAFDADELGQGGTVQRLVLDLVNGG